MLCVPVGLKITDPFGSVQRMDAEVLRPQPNPIHPFVNEPGILPGANVLCVINPARRYQVAELAVSALKPWEGAVAGRFQNLELDGPAGLLLDEDRA